MKSFIKKLLREELSDIRWVNGIGLENDQILGITTSDFGGKQRYYFNHRVSKFIPVIQMSSYNIDDFDCTKQHLKLAKKVAFQQDLDSKNIDLLKVRAKINEDLITEKKSEFTKLEDNKVPLTDDERKKVMDADATWNHGPNGAPSPAVWKSEDPKTGKVTFITNTHRAYNTAPTLKGAISRYHKFIKGTA